MLGKVRLFLKQCLHDLHFMKTRSYSPNLSKLKPQLPSAEDLVFIKLKKHSLQNEWILAVEPEEM